MDTACLVVFEMREFVFWNTKGCHLQNSSDMTCLLLKITAGHWPFFGFGMQSQSVTVSNFMTGQSNLATIHEQYSK